MRRKLTLKSKYQILTLAQNKVDFLLICYKVKEISLQIILKMSKGIFMIALYKMSQRNSELILLE